MKGLINKKEKAAIHIHSGNSRYDSTMSVKVLCKKAKELEYDSIALTDHGVLTGIDDFVSAAKEVGIKPIPGVEVYMQEDDSIYGRFHLVLLAVDDFGYQGIAKIVSESNKRIDTAGFPRVNKEILEKYCANESPYHGHIIATSACIGGVLAGILKSPQEFDRMIEKLKKKQSNYEDPSSKSHIKNRKALDEKKAELADLQKKRDELNKLSKKPYKQKEKMVEKLKGTESYEEELSKLTAEKAESEAAVDKLNDVRIAIAVTKKDISGINGRIKASEESHAKFKGIQKEIDEIESQKHPFDTLYEMTKKEAFYYDNLFGHDNFFIEIQYHGYLGDNGEPLEEALFTQLARLSHETGIPMIAGQDAHMVDGSEESIRARQIIRSIKVAKKNFTASVVPGDEELYLKDEASFKQALLSVLSEEDADTAIENAYEVGSRCNCKFEYGTHYPKYNQLPDGETADSLLKKMTYEKISFRYPKSEQWTNIHEERLDYELDVIANMGYSDYFLIVQDFLSFGRRLGYLSKENIEYLKQNVKALTLTEYVSFVDEHKEFPGVVIGPGRGSAAGSIVAYLIEITDIDPIEYDLLFERFLNKDRVSMPDIDSDFAREIRDLVVEYCKKLYGVETVANIVTKGYIAPKGAIRNTGRVIGLEKDQKDDYLQLADKIAKQIPNEPGMSFDKCEEDLRKPFAINKSDSPQTKKLKADANELIDQAKLVEGSFLNYGMHAAGVIIADGKPIDDYVPLMLDEKSGDMKVQCDMTQAEEIHGLLKFDFLGLRTLDIITEAVRSIYKRTGEIIDLRNLPFDPKVFKFIFAAAKTGCVFQFESAGMKQMLQDARPENIEDLIALVSLYRPGPMDFIPEYIKNKKNPDGITYLCKELEPILKKTYGVIVYQEQVMEIVQKLAGFSLSQADNVRRYMSKKKLDKLEHERESFIYGDKDRNIEGCLKKGISSDVANTIFDQMVDFAKYAFNKSHAAAYAIVAYQTAYLKYYYPVDFMCAALNYNDKIADIPSVLNDCREMGVEVLPPEVNKSNFGFSIYDDKIIFGLESIKGTKAASVQRILEERNKNGEFVSFKELLLKHLLDKSTCEGMISAGAMDEFNPNRMALQNYYSEVSGLLSKISKKKSDIEDILNDLKEKPEDEKLKTKLTKAEESLKLLNEQLDVIRIVNCPEDLSYRLKKEKEVLGFFVSAHPMDEYRSSEELGGVSIHDLNDTGNKVNIIGLVESLKITKTKKDGKEMAIFQLEDKTGIVDVCCFPKTYEKYGELIQEDAVLKLSGYVNVEEIISETDENDDDENEDGTVKVRIQFFVNDIYEIKPDANNIIIKLKSMISWNQVLQELRNKKLIANSGHPLVVFEELNGEFKNTYYYVKEDVLLDDAFECTSSD